jgi:hypothetical protein
VPQEESGPHCNHLGGFSFRVTMWQ